jgi:hypothetical protein
VLQVLLRKRLAVCISQPLLLAVGFKAFRHCLCSVTVAKCLLVEVLRP